MVSVGDTDVSETGQVSDGWKSPGEIGGRRPDVSDGMHVFEFSGICFEIKSK